MKVFMMKRVSIRIFWAMILAPSLLLGGVSKFPQTKSVFDTDDILSDYTPYLQFVTTIGRRADSKNTQKLVKLYDSLKKRNPDQAAAFLKGLRFELISKIDLMGVDPDTVNTNHPTLHRWVARYMKEWVREADEHLFRAMTNSQIAKAD